MGMVQRGCASIHQRCNVWEEERKKSVRPIRRILQFYLWHMSDVVIGKPLSHCLVLRPWQKMDKLGLGFRTDAVRHGALVLQHGVVVLCERLAYLGRHSADYISVTVLIATLVSLNWHQSDGVMEHGKDCASRCRLCAYIILHVTVRGLQSVWFCEDACSAQRVAVAYLLITVLCNHFPADCYWTDVFPSSNTDIILIRIVAQGSSSSCSSSSSSRQEVLRSGC